MSDLIKHKAVALRLTAGSDEAGYLAQIFPLPKTPTIVLMKHGELKEYITPGVSKEEFMRRFQTAFNAVPKPAPASTSQSGTAAAPPAASSSSSSSAPSNNQPTEQWRQDLNERASQRHREFKARQAEADRKAKEEQEKAREQAKAEAEAGANTEAAKKYKQAEAVKAAKQKQREERERVLKRIEDDKEERRVRAAEQKKQRIESQQLGSVAAALVSSPETKMPSTTKVGDMAYIQVRLFDGSTIRARFKATAPLEDVRRFVDENRTDGNTPYKLKQVLSPLPNKTIDDTEEGKQLGDLGLSPSSTLVLVPVPKYASAYGESGNIISQVIGLIASFFTWLMGLVGLGGRSGAARQPDDTTNQAPDQTRVRGFENPDDRRRDQQLYNGNSVSPSKRL